MKTALRLVALLFIVLSGYVNAQLVVKNDTISGTPLAMTMDSRISTAIDDLESSCDRKTTTRRPITDDDYSAPARDRKPARVLVANRELTNAEICRQNPRVAGFKIQVAVVKSYEEANKIKAAFRSRFPMLKVETDASLRPNYKILAGSYFTKASASADLGRVRSMYKSAVVVSHYIFCVEGK